MSSLRLALVLGIVALYILAVVGYITGLRFLLFEHHQWLLYVDKPIPLSLLLILLPVYSAYNRKTFAYILLIFFGLIWCLAGDIISMFQPSVPYAKHPQRDNLEITKGDKVFIYGMLCYMIGKGFYTVAFTVGVGKEIRVRFLHSIPFYAFGAMVITLVYAEIGNGFSYLVVYIFVECTMGWRALALTAGFPGSDRAKLLLWTSAVGSALLLAADTLTIYNAYYQPLHGATYASAGIYWLGQLLVAISVPRRLPKTDYFPLLK